MSSSRISNELRKAHDRLIAKADRLREVIMRSVTATDFSDWRAETMELLRDFESDLSAHFELEESGGFMNDIQRHAPRYHRKVQKLQKEHREMQETVNQLCNCIGQIAVYDGPAVEGVRKTIDSIVQQFASHEQMETRLAMNTYLYDDGGGD